MEPRWEQLGEEVLHRRTSSGWTQEEVWARGGPSDTLQTEIEMKRWKPSRSVKGTLKKIDIGMQWREGSSAAVLAGGHPTPLATQDPPNNVEPPQRRNWDRGVVEAMNILYAVSDLALEERNYGALKVLSGVIAQLADLLATSIDDQQDPAPPQSAYGLAARTEDDPKEDPH